MSFLKSTICAAALMGMSGQAMAETVSSAFASLDISISDIYPAIDMDFETLDVMVNGDGYYEVRAVADGLEARDSESVNGALTLTNENDFDVLVFVNSIGDASATTSIVARTPIIDLRYDANARSAFDGFQFGPGEAFASTNGSFTCADPDADDAAVECYAVFEDDFDDISDGLEVFVASNETVTLGFQLSAFAFGQAVVEPTPTPMPSPVPLPAGGLLLLTGLGLLGWRARKG